MNLYDDFLDTRENHESNDIRSTVRPIDQQADLPLSESQNHSTPPKSSEPPTLKRKLSIEPFHPPKKSFLPPDSVHLKKWSNFDVPDKPCDLQRPSLSYNTLCILAVLNAPHQIVSCSDVYSFILHHFAYYRFTTSLWQNCVRHLICGTKKRASQFFKKVGTRMALKNSGVFTLQDVKAAKSHANIEVLGYHHTEARDRGDLLQRMIDGTLGLPRQLFYQAIALQHRNLAGPENSAMFYHLMAGKIVPSEKRPLQYFKEYRKDHLGTEPKHDELWQFFDLSKNESYSNWGAGLSDGMEEGLSMDLEECEVFHGNVQKYFELQKSVKSKGFEDWETPLHCHVFDVVIFPNLGNFSNVSNDKDKNNDDVITIE